MKSLMTAFLATLIFIGSAFWAGAAASSGVAIQTNPTELKDYLRAFHTDPKKVMNTRLPTFDERGDIIETSSSMADVMKMTQEEVWQAHNLIRDKVCKSAGRDCSRDAIQRSKRAAIEGANTVENFLFETTYISKLSEMEAQNLLAGQVPRKPWSDSFWPTAKGLLGRRWMDKSFPDSSNDWMANYSHYLAYAPGSAGINAMSPAEKYDYLIGDSSYRLTNANWANGKYTYDKSGRVPGWTGLCHGWAPASFMTPAPKRSVTVPAVDGTMITFYPSDIKALATEAWGEMPPKTKLAGTKCLRPRPAQDENGRVIDAGCFDVNPGTWHIGIVNQMGVNKRSFVFDSQYDFQIWNYPIYSYHYRYFNPQTLQTSTTLGGAAVDISNYSIDKFRKYRAPNTKYVVGIEMDIFFSIETSPSTRPVQEPKLNSKKWVYDLELSEDGTILGGEWYSNFHPDFMWSVDPDGRVRSEGEDALTELVNWDGLSPVPDDLIKAARISSPRQQPVGKIVETLIRLSQETGP